MQFEFFTTFDHEALEILRLERFRAFFADTLAAAPICCTLDGYLVITCETSVQLDALLEDSDALCYFARVILGAKSVTLYFAGEEIWSENTLASEAELSCESNSDSCEERDMGTATLEKPATTSTKTPAAKAEASNPNFLPIESVAESLSSLTGQPVEEMLNKILASRPTMQFKDGVYLVPADSGDGAIDEWANSLKSKLRNGTAPTANNGTAKATAKPKSITGKKPTTRKPAAKTSSRKTTAKTTEA